MKSELDVKITLWSAFGIFALLFLWKLGSPDVLTQIPSIASSTVSLTVIGRFVFVKWVWKWPGFRWLERVHKTPLLEGKWTGQINSTGNDRTPADRLKVQVDVEICQPTIHQIVVKRLSDESRSRSLGESLINDVDDSVSLLYTYFSETDATVRERSPMSYGTAKLHYTKGNPDTLNGNYWSDQKTTGTMTLKRIM